MLDDDVGDDEMKSQHRRTSRQRQKRLFKVAVQRAAVKQYGESERVGPLTYTGLWRTVLVLYPACPEGVNKTLDSGRDASGPTVQQLPTPRR